MESRNKLTMCRLCLCERECFINIFKLNDWQGYVAAEVISDLLQFHVSETDVYPHVVCSKCIVKLTDFKLFKECCQESKVKYDNMPVSSESQEDNKPEIDIGVGGNGLELREQDLHREATSDMFPNMQPVIKQEELDVDYTSGDGSDKPFEETNTEEKIIKSEAIGNADAIEPTATSIEDATQMQLKPVETDSLPQYRQCLEQMRLHRISNRKADVDSCSMNNANDETIFNISSSVGIEASSSRTTERLGGQWIIPGERVYMTPLFHEDVSIGKKAEERRGREEKVTGEEGEGGRETAPEKRVEGHRERLECYHCGDVLSTKRCLLRHMALHGFGNYYECDICCKVFQRKDHLKNHMLTHTDSKPYKCSECGKCFSRSDSLKTHIRTHTDFKPYKCVECSKCFSRNGNLKIHMRSHTGSKPYKCVVCSKYFSHNGDLKRHMRLHTGHKPYKCAECSKSFNQCSALNTHLRLHTGSKPYKCEACGKSFSDSSNRRRHMRIHRF